MTPADRFARLLDLLSADDDLRRRGRWVTVECRVDIGSEPFHLSLSDGALAALDRGKLIEAIKLYRAHTNCGLKEAKDAVEALARARGI